MHAFSEADPTIIRFRGITRKAIHVILMITRDRVIFSCFIEVNKQPYLQKATSLTCTSIQHRHTPSKFTLHTVLEYHILGNFWSYLDGDSLWNSKLTKLTLTQQNRMQNAENLEKLRKYPPRKLQSNAFQYQNADVNSTQHIVT